MRHQLNRSTPLLGGRSLDNGYNTTDSTEAHSHLQPTLIDVEPYTAADVQPKTTQTQAILALCKGVMGTGVFSLPYAVSQAGLLGAIVSLIVLAWLSSHTMKSLANMKQVLYPTTGAAGRADTVGYYDLSRRILGESTARLVSFAVISCSIGVGIAYVQFVTCLCTTMFDTPRQYLIALLFPILVLLALIRSYRLIAQLSIIGNITIAICMLAVLIDGYTTSKHIPSLRSLYMHGALFVRFDTVISSIGMLAYVYATHFQVLPIQASMQQPSQFSRAVEISFNVTCLLCLLFGCTTFLFYTDSVSTIVLHNLKPSAYLDAVQIILCGSVILSFGIIFSPGCLIIEEALLSWLNDKAQSVQHPDDAVQLPSRHANTVRTVTRISLVFLTCTMALLIPSFSVIVDLLGGVSMSALAFVFPTAMALRCHYVVSDMEQTETTKLNVNRSRANLLLLYGIDHNAEPGDTDMQVHTPTSNSNGHHAPLLQSTRSVWPGSQQHADTASNAPFATSDSQATLASNDANALVRQLKLSTWQRVLNANILLFGLTVIVATLSSNLHNIWRLFTTHEVLANC